ncbi:MAG: SRPBCC family protein [Sphingorhabdus sp.]
MSYASPQIEHDDAPVVTSKKDKGSRDLLASSVTINRPAQEVYALFRDFSRLPEFMENIERIDVLDERLSHWVVKAPGGAKVEWDARVTEDIEGRSITWQSETGADVANSGRITFDDAGPRGTVVTATIAYDPPAGLVGKLIAKIFQREPSIQTRRDLRRLKQYLETGEIATAARNRAMRAAEEE